MCLIQLTDGEVTSGGHWQIWWTTRHKHVLIYLCSKLRIHQSVSPLGRARWISQLFRRRISKQGYSTGCLFILVINVIKNGGISISLEGVERVYLPDFRPSIVVYFGWPTPWGSVGLYRIECRLIILWTCSLKQSRWAQLNLVDCWNMILRRDHRLYYY